MSLDRLDSVVIGKRCEADGCECVAVTGQDRCFDHSVDRLIEALFVNEKCRFGGVNCEGNASRVNEHDVLMCESCYNIYQRIQRGGRHSILTNTGPYFGDMPRSDFYGPSQGFMSPTPRESDLCTCNNLDHSDYNEECPLNGDEEEVEEMLDLMERANELDRLRAGRNPPGTTYEGRTIAIDEEQYASFMRGMLGIPPMRRDEGEETE